MPLTSTQREKIVAEAESWIKTPYAGNSRCKGAGVDCGQLIAGIMIGAGFLSPDITLPINYPLQILQHRKDTTYIDTVRQYMREIPEAEVLPGDVVMYQIGFGFTHSGLIVEWPKYVIQALEQYGVTAADGMNTRFGKLEKRFFTLKDEQI